MIQLLFTVIFSEMALIMTLLFNTPLRKLVVMGLDRIKRGRGPVMVTTVGGTIFVVLISSVYSMVKIQQRTLEAGAVNPTDQVLMSQHMLEASLMGFLLFLALMIDRLHYYIRELRLLRKAMEAAKKQNQSFEEGKNANTHELKGLENEITKLRKKIKKLESEHDTKEKECSASKAEAEALKKQSEGFLLEYDRLLEENQSLRNQLESIDQSVTQSDGKKNM